MADPCETMRLSPATASTGQTVGRVSGHAGHASSPLPCPATTAPPPGDALPAASNDEQEQLPERPRVRSECAPGAPGALRPCPWVSCRFHTALNVSARGIIQSRAGVQWALNGKEDKSDAIADEVVSSHLPTCALDVIDELEGGATLQEVADVLSCSRERVRQVEERAMSVLREAVRRLTEE